MTDAGRKLRLDPEEMRFQAKVMTVAQRDLAASCEGSGAESFLKRVYSDYAAAGKPADAEGWMRQYLSQRFLSVDTPPRWVEDEPAWPFLNGEPMIFVTQYTLPSTSVAASRLTSGTEVYVFGARVPHPKGYTIEYQVVQQHPGIDGIGDR